MHLGFHGSSIADNHHLIASSGDCGPAAGADMYIPACIGACDVQMCCNDSSVHVHGLVNITNTVQPFCYIMLTTILIKSVKYSL